MAPRSPILVASLLFAAGAATSASAFVPSSTSVVGGPAHILRMSDTAAAVEDTAAAPAPAAVAVSIDPKEAVKLFGRLAEKYIMLDASGGLCCYSACSDCEYRDPNGGYIMADQSAARPKWIPSYEHREFESSGKEHTSKWSTDIYVSKERLVVTKAEFVEAVREMVFAPPLGGPFMSASAGKKMDDIAGAEALFDVLAGEKDKLTKHRMGTEMKSLAGGEEGLTWPKFAEALGVDA